ncbi:hypothetical protein ABT040_40085 [Streptomyces sp. NPDC002688]|uniref:hypothetical protein n=1 Tax=Streptomyces sp. NPDC002688 TaxID=3154423 RepID=UPI0033310769
MAARQGLDGSRAFNFAPFPSTASLNLFDGRQVEVLVRCLGGQPSDTLEFLNKSTLVEEWEHSVAAALAVLCYRAADEHPVEPIDNMVQHYLAVDTVPELAVFRSRVGLVLLDLSPQTRREEALRRLTHEATTHAAGYVARDVLAHPVCREGLSHDERRKLSAAVASAGLGQGHISEPLVQALRDAASVSADVWERQPELREPAKCTQWTFWDPAALPDDLVPYTRVAIEGIRASRLYSETGWA